MVKLAQWKKEKEMAWLKKYLIPSIVTDDLEFIKTGLKQLTNFVSSWWIITRRRMGLPKQLVDNHKMHGIDNTVLRKNWTSILAFCPMALVLPGSRQS
jgi:hypothetical protein